MGLMTLLGCDRDPMVRVYEAPKDPVIARPVPPQRTAQLDGPTRFLIAVVPIGDQVYFIKAQDQPKKLDGIVDGLRQIASKMKRAEGGEIDFALPESWSRKPGTGIAMATLEVTAGAEPISFLVTELAGPSDSVWESFLEPNINRWRRQLSLPEISYAEQSKSLIRVDREGAETPAWIVDLQTEATGVDNAQSEPSAKKPTTPKGPSADAFDLKFETPEGWVRGATNQFRIASFEIKEGDSTGEVTVVSAGGDQLSNVARWQGQISPELSKEKIDELSKQAIDRAFKVKTSHGVEGKLYSLVGPEGELQPAILAAILPLANSNTSLFVKLTAPAKVADAHRARLTEFLSSMKW
jgi:hypothetical protein